LLRAVIITALASLIGLGVNLVSPRGIPWLYAPPHELAVGGAKIPLIEVKEAFESLEDGESIFLDTRASDEYAESHIKGALSLPAGEMEERFTAMQPLLPQESRIVLYCSSPECEMAEQVASFLAQLGYKKLAIIAPGFPGWTKAGYPVESSKKEN
jgi:rhodanese-related sulfurtransferase